MSQGGTGSQGTQDVVALYRLIDAHIEHTCEFLEERSRVLAEAVQAGTCAIIGLGYHLDEGRARLVRAIGDVGEER